MFFFNIIDTKFSFHFLSTGFYLLLNIFAVDIFIMLTIFTIHFFVENM